MACPLFVPLVEEGLEIDPLTNLISYRYLNHLNELNVDTVILGCTHYPRLHLAIRKVLGQTVTLSIRHMLSLKTYCKRLGPGPKQKGKTTILCTDTTEQFQAMIPRILSNAEQFEVIQWIYDHTTVLIFVNSKSPKGPILDHIQIAWYLQMEVLVGTLQIHSQTTSNVQLILSKAPLFNIASINTGS